MMAPRPPSRVVACEYCGTENMVPDAIWKALYPLASASPLPPAPQIPIPAPAPRKANVVLIAVILVFVGVTFIIPVVMGLCGACLSLVGGVAGSSKVTQPAPPITVVSTKQGPVSIKLNQGGGSPFDNVLPGGTVPTTHYAAPGVVTPSFENADVYATAQAIFDAVRKNWYADAKLGMVVLVGVGSDGTADLSAPGGSMVMDFYLPGRAKDLPPGETTVKDGQLKVVVSNGTVMEVPVDVQTTIMSLTPMIESMPACTVAGLWKEAAAEGYPADAKATIIFPHEPSSLTSREKEHLEDYYAYLFTMPDGNPAGKPMYFLLKNCRAK